MCGRSYEPAGIGCLRTFKVQVAIAFGALSAVDSTNMSEGASRFCALRNYIC